MPTVLEAISDKSSLTRSPAALFPRQGRLMRVGGDSGIPLWMDGTFWERGGAWRGRASASRGASVRPIHP